MSVRTPEIETMPREDIKKLQSERLVWQVKRMYERVECFRNRMDEKGLKPEDIHGIEDLPKLPFSYKKICAITTHTASLPSRCQISGEFTLQAALRARG